jgi:hypothetical protein
VTRPRSRRAVVVLLIVGLGVPALCWVVLGMPPLQAMLLGAVAVTVAALALFPPDGFDIGFPEPPPPIRDRGARREVFRLSWNVAGREDRVGSTLISRLQAAAARRLALRGLRLHDPADRERVIALVGERPYRLLNLPPGSDAPARAFVHTLGVVERLADLPPDPHRPTEVVVPDQPEPASVPKENR